MPIFFIILITVYLGGNTYIFYRGMQALSGLPCGIKISLAVLFWLATLSIVGTMLTRNIKMPAVRYDENVINKHLEMLADEPEMQELYQLVSENIHRLHNK